MQKDFINSTANQFKSIKHIDKRTMFNSQHSNKQYVKKKQHWKTQQL